MQTIVVTDLDDTSVLVEISDEDLNTLSELENRANNFWGKRAIIPGYRDEDEIEDHIEKYNSFLGQLITQGQEKGNTIEVYKPIQ